MADSSSESSSSSLSSKSSESSSSSSESSSSSASSSSSSILPFCVFPPDWDQGMQKSHTWRTSIQETITGREKRSTLKTKKLRRIAYTSVILNRDELIWAQSMLFWKMYGQWGFPIWTDRAILSIAANIGDLTLNVSATADRNFVVGDYCILISKLDFRIHEGHEIANVLATAINLSTPLIYNWTNYSYIYPVFFSRLRPEETISLDTKDAAIFSIDAIEMDE